MTKLIDSFAPISLEQMKSVKLMNRIDTKFVTNQQKLCQLLEMAQQDYFIQQIDGKSNLEYDTTYFDKTARRYASAPIASLTFSLWRLRRRIIMGARRRNALR